MRNLFYKILSLTFLTVFPFVGFAQIKEKTPFWESELFENSAILLVSVVILLLIAIAAMGKALHSTVHVFKNKLHLGKMFRDNMKNALVTIFAVLIILIPFGVYAQEDLTGDANGMIAGISTTSFYALFSVIVLELIILFLLLVMFRHFASLRNPISKEEHKKREKLTWLERINATKSLDAASEEAISLGHDYDGIGELDNPTPPWWNWFFIISVVYAVVYLWMVHGAKILPMQEERLEIAYEKAEKAKEAYLAKAGNLIDETNVEYMDAETDLAAGKQIFANVCAACHGQNGEGGVGPNLVDDYWLHGGDIKDIFSVIKYGVLDKGMASWQDQYSPREIAQVASYIVSIRGKEVQNPKDPEGDLYVPNDSEEQDGLEEDAEETMDEVALN